VISRILEYTAPAAVMSWAPAEVTQWFLSWDPAAKRLLCGTTAPATVAAMIPNHDAELLGRANERDLAARDKFSLYVEATFTRSGTSTTWQPAFDTGSSNLIFQVAPTRELLLRQSRKDSGNASGIPYICIGNTTLASRSLFPTGILPHSTLYATDGDVRPLTVQLQSNPWSDRLLGVGAVAWHMVVKPNVGPGTGTTWTIAWRAMELIV
jgi:hypothetical protein